jgi:hypothetical protein
MTRNRELVPTAITLLVVSGVVIPQDRIAVTWPMVQCAQLVQRVLPVKAFSFPQLNPTCPQCL